MNQPAQHSVPPYPYLPTYLQLSECVSCCTGVAWWGAEGTPAAHHTLLKAREVMVHPVVQCEECTTIGSILDMLESCERRGLSLLVARLRR
jgi:hypothetical protein